MVAIVIFALAVTLVVQTIRAEVYRSRLPPKSPSVVKGYLLPNPNDERWQHGKNKSGVPVDDWFVLEGAEQMQVDRRPAPNNSFYDYLYRIRIDNHEIEGWAARRYWKTVKRSYIQRKALEAIEGLGRSDGRKKLT